jgi:hypothetical protein
MSNLIFIATLSIILFGCSSKKLSTSNLTKDPKSVVIIYDQQIREFPSKNPTNRVIPAIFLPMQQEAFQLDRTQRFARKVLILRFDPSDDSSKIQIMANRFSAREWLYTDTILPIRSLPELNTCVRIQITTIRNKEFGIIPQLTLVPFVCRGDEDIVYSRRMLIYDIPTQRISGTDNRIYRKGGYPSLFKGKLFAGGTSIKVSDVIH